MSDDIQVTQPNGLHLAELNIGMAVDDLDMPTMAGLMNVLDNVNRIADRSLDSVWRLQDGAGNATEIKHSDNPRENSIFRFDRQVPILNITSGIHCIASS